MKQTWRKNMAKKRTEIIDDTDSVKAELIEQVKARIEAANDKTFGIIEDFITGGYEENLARLLIYLPEERRKNALQNLNPAIREKVSSILDNFAEKTNSDADVLCAVGTVLKNADFYGEKAVKEVSQSNDIYFKLLLEKEKDNLVSVNPLLAMNIEYYTTNIDILLLLDDRSIQKWLREIDTQDIAIALKGATADIQDKIFRNMSQRASTMLREEMEFMGPVRKSDVLERQRKLLDILKRLEDNGEIVISSNEEDELI